MKFDQRFKKWVPLLVFLASEGFSAFSVCLKWSLQMEDRSQHYPQPHLVKMLV